MVTFNDDRFIIDIYTGGNPVEEWLALHDDLCQLLADQDDHLSEKHHWVCNLLRELTPDISVAIKMTSE
jgi:hypothetical protein